ncbi:MAG TPA: hypothetical protein VFS00_27380 [Polyangiaceae bacterium]|nr:hypothetical protein [Polyangiaceae bacterium]
MLPLETILRHAHNALVLAHLKVGPTDYFAPGDEVSPFDEGGMIFLHQYARHLPPEAKFVLGTTNVLAHPRSGRIFACHWGRFTIAVRCDFERAGLASTDRLRIAETLDGRVDIRCLGAEWALLQAVGGDDEEEALGWAYELACREHKRSGGESGESGEGGEGGENGEGGESGEGGEWHGGPPLRRAVGRPARTAGRGRVGGHRRPGRGGAGAAPGLALRRGHRPARALAGVAPRSGRVRAMTRGQLEHIIRAASTRPTWRRANTNDGTARAEAGLAPAVA